MNVEHEILINKLEYAGIRGTASQLNTEYLSERKQIIRIKKTMSGQTTVKIGVPQGFVLGALPFIVFLMICFN